MWEHSGRMYRPDRGAASTRMAVKQDRTAHTGPWIHLLPRRPERRLGLVQAIRRPRRVASSAALGSQEIPKRDNDTDHNHRFHREDCHAVLRHRLLDHFVSPQPNRRRHGEAERLRGLEVHAAADIVLSPSWAQPEPPERRPALSIIEKKWPMSQMGHQAKTHIEHFSSAILESGRRRGKSRISDHRAGRGRN